MTLNFASFSLRRHEEVLEVLFERKLGKYHTSFEELLVFLSQRCTVIEYRGNNKALYGHWNEGRSIYAQGLI